MKCPVCSDTQLLMGERQGVEIDYCPACRGIWLDRGELDKLIERSSTQESQRRADSGATQTCRRMSPQGLRLTMECEGMELKAYPDPGSGGHPWTIGYGHTKGVKPGHTCTREQAARWLVEDISWAEVAVNQLVQVPLTQNKYDALVNFVFNVGRANFAKSTLLRKLNNADYTGAAEEFGRWNKAGGKVLRGLVRRRAKEKELFLKV